MIKRICFILAILMLLALAAGCSFGSTATTTTQSAGVKQLRHAQLAEGWLVKHLEIDLENNISIMLTLAEGDEVEGFFYMEKGNGLNFQITGQSLIYESKPAGTGTGIITSDRFAFTASDGQGKAYTLKISAAGNGTTAASQATTTVFLEIIYPASSEIFVPMGTK